MTDVRAYKRHIRLLLTMSCIAVVVAVGCVVAATAMLYLNRLTSHSLGVAEKIAMVALIVAGLSFILAIMHVITRAITRRRCA